MRRLYMSAEGIRTSLQLKQLCWLDSGGDGSALVSDVHGNSCSLKGARLDRSAHSGGLGARVSRPAKVSTVLPMSMVDTRGGRSSTVRVESGSVSSGSKRLIQTVAFGTSSTLGARFQSWVRAVRQRRHVDRLRDWMEWKRQDSAGQSTRTRLWILACRSPRAPRLYQDCTSMAARCTPGSACRHQPFGGAPTRRFLVWAEASPTY